MYTDDLISISAHSEISSYYSPDTSSQDVTAKTQSIAYQALKDTDWRLKCTSDHTMVNLAKDISNTANKGNRIGLIALGLVFVFGIGLLFLPILLPIALHYREKSNSMQAQYDSICNIYVETNRALANRVSVEEASSINSYIEGNPTERMLKRALKKPNYEPPRQGIAVTPFIDPANNRKTQKYAIHLWDKNSEGLLGIGGQGIVKKELVYDPLTGNSFIAAMKKDIKKTRRNTREIIQPKQNLHDVESLKRRLMEQPIPHIEAQATLMADLGNGRWCAIYDIAQGDANDREFTDVKDFQRFNYQVAVAINALHDLNVIHRDIKPHNIFVDNNGEPIIGDFGGAIESGQEKKPWGTWKYMPSQAFKRLEPSKGQDVHAFGVTLLQLMSHFLNDHEKKSELTKTAQDALEKQTLKNIGRMPPSQYHDEIKRSIMSAERFEEVLNQYGFNEKDKKFLIDTHKLCEKIITGKTGGEAITMAEIVRHLEPTSPDTGTT